MLSRFTGAIRSTLSLGPGKQLGGSLQQQYNRALRKAGVEADSQVASDIAKEGAARWVGGYHFACLVVARFTRTTCLMVDLWDCRLKKVEGELQQLMDCIMEQEHA